MADTTTGRTHQLQECTWRRLGIPSWGTPRCTQRDGPSWPPTTSAHRRSVAQRIEFDDPLTGSHREFASTRTLTGATLPTWSAAADVGRMYHAIGKPRMSEDNALVLVAGYQDLIWLVTIFKPPSMPP